MKKLKLNLDQLSEELEILDFEYLRDVKAVMGIREEVMGV